MTRRPSRLAAAATPLVVLCLVATGCSGSGTEPDGASPTAAQSPAPDAPDDSTAPAEPAEPSETLDPDLVSRAVSVQSAQQALADGGRGTFVVRLTDGERDGLLPTVEGGYDVSVPAGEFTATTAEADRDVVLRYRARAARAWSQVLYPGSPLAPDCWYELAVADGAVALPAQVSALFDLEPDEADPESGTSVLLLDALNAVGLTRLANLLGEDAAAARVPARVALRGEEEDARFASWSLTGADLLDALDGAALDGAAQRALAEARPVLPDASWRVVLEGGDPGRISPPPGRTVLVAGDTCSRSR